ncbi:MAG: hypothetical protein U9N13_01560 [Euryarchaeota archaeon]|nr:hypothetical protein [Euryarchaeota archaeon]
MILSMLMAGIRITGHLWLGRGRAGTNDSNSIVAVEIFNASNIFGVSKHESMSPITLKIDVNVPDDVITVSLYLVCIKRNEKLARTASVSGINDTDLSSTLHTLAFA